SRRRHTRFSRDWSSDVCSSDLLDPQFGFLHVLRPGRPALALDLVEEFRSVILDRLAFTLINRKQIQASDFECREGGAVSLTDEEIGRASCRERVEFWVSADSFK